MASLTWRDVVLIGAAAFVGFTLLSFWFSGVMSRRNWSWQVRPKKAEPAKPAAPAAPPREPPAH